MDNLVFRTSIDGKPLFSRLFLVLLAVSGAGRLTYSIDQRAWKKDTNYATNCEDESLGGQSTAQATCLAM
jgi:hypothetical protein